MSRWKYQFSYDHWSQASWAQPVSRWVTFWGVAGAAVEQSRRKANVVAQGDGEIRPQRLTLESLQTKKKRSPKTICCLWPTVGQFLNVFVLLLFPLRSISSFHWLPSTLDLAWPLFLCLRQDLSLSLGLSVSWRQSCCFIRSLSSSFYPINYHTIARFHLICERGGGTSK